MIVIVIEGLDIQYIHRVDRTGFKAGALEHGLKSARGEYVMVFDADFLPAPDIIERTVHFFTNDKVGMVQVRWDHVNRDYSRLTELQAMMLDGHFVIEHTARHRSGRFFNFDPANPGSLRARFSQPGQRGLEQPARQLVGLQVVVLRPGVDEGALRAVPRDRRAVEVARERGATTIGLSGFSGGKLASLVDLSIVVPCDNMQRIEDLHMILGHLFFWRMLQAVKERRGSHL